MELNTLREYLADWRDFDGAAYGLSLCLGIVLPNVEWKYAKGIFWSNNPIGNVLYSILEKLVESGVLEKRDEPDFQFRWNPNFNGYWEK